jgi:hypothetical protein
MSIKIIGRQHSLSVIGSLASLSGVFSPNNLREKEVLLKKTVRSDWTAQSGPESTTK